MVPRCHATWASSSIPCILSELPCMLKLRQPPRMSCRPARMATVGVEQTSSIWRQLLVTNSVLCLAACNGSALAVLLSQVSPLAVLPCLFTNTACYRPIRETRCAQTMLMMLLLSAKSNQLAFWFVRSSLCDHPQAVDCDRSRRSSHVHPALSWS